MSDFTKECTWCIKPLIASHDVRKSDFSKNSKTKDGFSNACNPCLQTSREARKQAKLKKHMPERLPRDKSSLFERVMAKATKELDLKPQSHNPFAYVSEVNKNRYTIGELMEKYRGVV